MLRIAPTTLEYGVEVKGKDYRLKWAYRLKPLIYCKNEKDAAKDHAASLP